MKKRVLAYIGYVVVFGLALFLGLYLAFPYERIRDLVEQKAQEALGVEVSVGAISLYRLTGLQLRDVVLLADPEKRSEDPKGEEKGAQEEPGSADAEDELGVEDVDGKPDLPPKGEGAIKAPRAKVYNRELLRLEQVALRVRILPLFLGRVNVGLGIEGLGGTVTGSLNGVNSKSAMAFNVSWNSLDLSLLRLTETVLGFPLEGTLNGSIEANINSEAFSDSVGKLTLDLSDGQLGTGRIPLPPGMIFGHFDLNSTTDLGNLQMELILGDHEDLQNAAVPPRPGPAAPMGTASVVAQLITLNLDSEDLAILGTGRITLVQGNTGLSRPDLRLSIQLKDDFVDRNHLAPILGSRQFKMAEREGFYGLTLQGTLSKINPRFVRPEPIPKGAPRAQLD